MRIDTDDRRAVEVFYDGACPVCRREVAAYRCAVPGDAIAWVDVADDAAPAPAGVERAALLARFHVRRADGELASGATAFFAVWRTMPRLRRVAALLDRPAFLWIAEQVYRAFLAVRPLWRRTSRARGQARAGRRDGQVARGRRGRQDDACTRPRTTWPAT